MTAVVTLPTRSASSHCSCSAAVLCATLLRFCVFQVVVTGAAGRTGGLIVQQLLADKEKFNSIKATVRAKKSATALLSAGLPEPDIVEFDLAAAAAAVSSEAGAGVEPNTARLAEALQGADALVICTSGVPQVCVLWTAAGT